MGNGELKKRRGDFASGNAPQYLMAGGGAGLAVSPEVAGLAASVSVGAVGWGLKNWFPLW